MSLRTQVTRGGARRPCKNHGSKLSCPPRVLSPVKNPRTFVTNTYVFCTCVPDLPEKVFACLKGPLPELESHGGGGAAPLQEPSSAEGCRV